MKKLKEWKKELSDGLDDDLRIKFNLPRPDKVIRIALTKGRIEGWEICEEHYKKKIEKIKDSVERLLNDIYRKTTLLDSHIVDNQKKIGYPLHYKMHHLCKDIWALCGAGSELTEPCYKNFKEKFLELFSESEK